MANTQPFQPQTQANGNFPQQIPAMFGFTVFDSIRNASDGKIPYPERGEKQIGGHAILCVGYDDSMKIGKCEGAFLIRNSWGEEWEAVPVIELEGDPRIAELLVLCEPAARAEPSEGPLAAAAEERAFADRWARASRLARSLMHEEGASSSAAGARGV